MPAKKPRKSLEKQKLEQLVGQTVTVFLGSGKAITGKLLSFDKENLSIEGEAGDSEPLLYKRHVSMVRLALQSETARHQGKRHGRTP